MDSVVQPLENWKNHPCDDSTAAHPAWDEAQYHLLYQWAA
jgi:hypothetical protein